MKPNPSRFQILANSRGGAPALAIVAIAILIVLPSILISANESTVKSLADGQIRQRMTEEVDNFVSGVYGSVRGIYSCTKNLQQMGLLGQHHSALKGRSFSPYIVEDKENGTNPVPVPGDGDITNRKVTDEVGEVLLKNMTISSNVIKDCKDNNCIQPKSNKMALYKWELGFTPDANKKNNQLPILSGFHVPRSILMMVGIDSSQRIVGCRLSMTSSDLVVEDKICKVLNAGVSGKMGNYVMLTSSHPAKLVQEGCE